MAARSTPPPSTALPRNRLRAGTLTFLGLTGAGLVGLFTFGAREAAPLRLADLHAGFLFLALASMVLDAALGGLRLQIFIRRIRPRSPLWLPIRADLAGRFVGSVTPSYTGGGPGQVFVLHRGGVPVAASLSLLLVNLISTLLCLLLVGGFSVWRIGDHFGQSGLLALPRYGYLAVLALLGVTVALLVRPEMLSRPLERFTRRPDRNPGRPPTVLERAAELLVDNVEHFRVASRIFVRECPWLPAASLGLSALMYLNRFGMAWLVMRGLGIERDFTMTVALVALAQFCVVLAPSPGGSGVAEVATGAILSALIPASVIGPFTLVYRLLQAYLPAAVGGCCLLAELRPRPARAPTRIRSAAAAGLAIGLGLAVEASAGPRTGCPICGDAAPSPTPLLRAEVEATAASLAARNLRVLGRIDSLLLEGRFGPPDGREARSRAQLLARVTLENWYSFLLPFAADSQRVHALAPEAIAPVAERYCEALAVPMPRLRELRLGKGYVCARYDLGSDEQGWTVLGGRRLPYRVGSRAFGGQLRRVLGLDWPSGGLGKVEVLVEEHYFFRFAGTRSSDEEGNPCDLFMALEVTGAWVRRYGVHRATAFAFWAARPSNETPTLPCRAQVGAAIYVPGLKFRLPLLPDIPLDDLRVLGLPMPFLDADDLRRGSLPAWLSAEGDLSLADWTSEGPVPAVLREYLPDR